MPGDLQLHDGARIVIVGAGPAGAFFAHHARSLAQQRGWELAITLCDGKNFTHEGPLGCNMCAGVISAPLAERLDQAGFLLPDDRVQRHIDGYYLTTVAGGIALDHPDGKRGIRTVFRGNGPRYAKPGGNISFDDWLLDHVKAQGVALVPHPVQRIVRPSDPSAPLRVQIGRPHEPEEIAADLVVGACGLNTAFLEQMRQQDFGYQSPQTRRVCQAELLVGRDWIEQRMHNRIVVLAVRVSAVTLAVLTPKDQHLTLTLMGDRDVKIGDLHDFLRHPATQAVLPPGWQLPRTYCHCFPRLPVTAAKRPFADRLVLIGDASFSRYYKNGIESAFVTAQLAAETAIRHGVSAADFNRYYQARADRLIVRDNFYGRLLFRVPEVVGSNAVLADAQRRVLADRGRSGRRLRRAVWNVLTGDLPYRQVFWQLWNPRLLGKLALAVFAGYLARRSLANQHQVQVA